MRSGGRGDDRTRFAPVFARSWTRADRCLKLSATPTFVVVGLHTALAAHGVSDATCGAARVDAHATGMVVMYGLMGVFHGTPWLRMIFGRPASSAAGSVTGTE